MQNLAKKRRLGIAVRHGWMRLIGAARPRYRFAAGRGRLGPATHQPPAVPIAAPAANQLIDPVALTILAVNRLGPATLRTAANGKALTVTVPDETVGEIFRAALAQMQKTRTTDRLLQIVVAGEPAATT